LTGVVVEVQPCRLIGNTEGQRVVIRIVGRWPEGVGRALGHRGRWGTTDHGRSVGGDILGYRDAECWQGRRGRTIADSDDDIAMASDIAVARGAVEAAGRGAEGSPGWLVADAERQRVTIGILGRWCEAVGIRRDHRRLWLATDARCGVARNHPDAEGIQ